MSNKRTTDTQELPIPNDEEIAHYVVCKDLEERLKLGIKKYGQGLQPFNGRNSLKDAYEEVQDLAVYLNCANREMEEIRKILREWRTAYRDFCDCDPDSVDHVKINVRLSNAESALHDLTCRLLGEEIDA